MPKTDTYDKRAILIARIGSTKKGVYGKINSFKSDYHFILNSPTPPSNDTNLYITRDHFEEEYPFLVIVSEDSPLFNYDVIIDDLSDINMNNLNFYASSSNLTDNIFLDTTIKLFNLAKKKHHEI